MLKKLGKIAVTVSTLSITTMALADAPSHMAMPSQKSNTRGNFFLGVTGGVGMLDGTYSAVGDVSTDQRVFTPNAGGTSFLGGLLLGYQTVFSNRRVYLAIVGNALYNSLNRTVFNVIQSGTTSWNTAVAKNSFQGGLAIRLGKRMNNGVTPYILGGAEAGRWRLSVANDRTSAQFGIPANTTVSASKTLIGPQAGAGVLFDIRGRWQAGFEYAYTWFGDVSFASASTSAYTHKLTTGQNQVLASVVYRFNR